MSRAPIERARYSEHGAEWPVLVWRAPAGSRAASSAVLGGGIRPVDAWMNAMVHRDYAEPDPEAHVRSLAARLGITGRVCGMITAADVRRHRTAEDAGVRVVATVGLGVPVLAASPEPVSPDPAPDRRVPGAGTINLLVDVPVALSDAALLNALMTATEAKTQALFDAGFRATGTASDAVCVVCPQPEDPILPSASPRPRHREGDPETYVPPPPPEPYGGPRSTWGARVARAVHQAVLVGALEWRASTQAWEGASVHRALGRPAPG